MGAGRLREDQSCWRCSRVEAQVVEGATRDLHDVRRAGHALGRPVHPHGEVPPRLPPRPHLRWTSMVSWVLQLGDGESVLCKGFG